MNKKYRTRIVNKPSILSYDVKIYFNNGTILEHSTTRRDEAVKLIIKSEAEGRHCTLHNSLGCLEYKSPQKAINEGLLVVYGTFGITKTYMS